MKIHVWYSYTHTHTSVVFFFFFFIHGKNLSWSYIVDSRIPPARTGSAFAALCLWTREILKYGKRKRMIVPFISQSFCLQVCIPILVKSAVESQGVSPIFLPRGAALRWPSLAPAAPRARAYTLLLLQTKAGKCTALSHLRQKGGPPIYTCRVFSFFLFFFCRVNYTHRDKWPIDFLLITFDTFENTLDVHTLKRRVPKYI